MKTETKTKTKLPKNLSSRQKQNTNYKDLIFDVVTKCKNARFIRGVPSTHTNKEHFSYYATLA